MRLYHALILLFASLTACTPDTPTRMEKPNPEPITLTDAGEGADEATRENARELYFEKTHRAAPGVDWERLEAHNAMARHRKRAARPGAVKSVETFAGGLLTGEWFERGSNSIDGTGSIYDVVQDPNDADRIFLMSSGGSIWETRLTTQAYELVNHDIYFDGEYLGLVPTATGYHLIAYSDRRPMFSADEGATWEFAEVIRNGVPVAGQDVTNWFSPQVFGDRLVAYLQVDGQPYTMYTSTDGGLTYTEAGLPDPTPDGSAGITFLHAPDGTDRLFLLLKRMYVDPMLFLYEVDFIDDEAVFTLVNTVEIETEGYFRGRLAAAPQPGTADLRIYLQADNQLFRSDDDGGEFREMPRQEKTPWRYVAVYTRPSNPDYVAYADIELYVSYDGGETFNRPNRWYDYYDDPYRYLHADVMRMKELTDAQGELQLLVSNHGGLNRYNPDDSLYYSIATSGLNTAQYYDVSTNPGDQSIIYAGSQDQGFQILNDPDPNGREILSGYQDFSGDFGHTVFSDGGNTFATAYPFGLVYFFWGVLDGQYNWADYRVENGDEFIWIAPMMSPTRTDDEDIVYLAGGSADSLSDGSHLIKLTLDKDFSSPTYGEVLAENKPFDFIDAAAGNISAMTFSPLNPERFYVATEEGRFFRSDDEGDTWDETLNFLPTGWYLYGQAIHASKTDEETVWLGGSGYSNPPVWRSTDGGENFEPVSEGLPATTVNGLVANAAESLIFAATEAGPFIYVVSEERWFDLSGQFAPTMRYVSVEFIEERNLARFGTYGRGAWDFQVEELVSTEAPVASADRLRVFPNPARAVTTVEGTAAGYRLYDVTGREVQRVTASGARTQVPLGGLKAGLYFVQPLDAGGREAGLATRLVVE